MSKKREEESVRDYFTLVADTVATEAGDAAEAALNQTFRALDRKGPAWAALVATAERSVGVGFPGCGQ